jgi:hypothetical protein
VSILQQESLKIRNGANAAAWLQLWLQFGGVSEGAPTADARVEERVDVSGHPCLALLMRLGAQTPSRVRIPEPPHLLPAPRE